MLPSAELFEETGATKCKITPIASYTIHFSESTPPSSGVLCFASIYSIGCLPESEIEEVGMFEKAPPNLTYPMVHPYLMEKAADYHRAREHFKI